VPWLPEHLVPRAPALRLSSLTFALCVLLAVHAIAIPLALRAAFQTPRDETIVGHVERFAHRRQADDSWRPMEAARAYARAHPGGDIYEEIFFGRKLKFQYPPSSLLFIAGLSRHALNLVSWGCVWITVAFTVALFRGAMQTGESPVQRAGVFDLLVRFLAVAGLCLSFYPLIKGYTLGQIQLWVDALFAAALWAWYAGRPAASGICLGIACLIKPPLFVLALWALVRRQRAMLAGMLATCCIGVSISVAVYGFSSHVSYLRVLSFISQRGEAYYPNQSVNGLVNRWLANGDNLKFQKFEFPPPNVIVSRATITAAIVLLLLALIVPGLRQRDDPRFDLPLMGATATIISPIAWEHHYGVWPPILALLVPAVLDLTEARWRVAAALSLAFVLTAQYFSPIQRLADTAWNPLQSYVFFGALLLIATAYGVMVRARDRVADTVARPTVP
jgi:alpha-1,2-mannosyltransferase